MIKEIEFLQPVRLTLAGTRRVSQPAASGAAQAGKSAVDQVIIKGKVKRINPAEAIDIPIGGKIKIATPGGGGYQKDQSSN
jgi:N-methylhydantoinase B/oxoprolinase/acetone carboxylase alpha subunit